MTMGSYPPPGPSYNLIMTGPSKLLGRYSAGSGPAQELTISTGLSLDASGNLTTYWSRNAGVISPATATDGLVIDTTTLIVDAVNDCVGVGIVPTEKLHVNGAIKLGTTTLSANGTIRWTGEDFEGFMDGNWVSMTAGVTVLEGVWRFTTSVVDATNQNIGFNNADYTLATEVHIAEISDAGIDRDYIFSQLSAGDTIIVQDKNESGRVVRYTISGTVVDNGTWRTIPVTYLSWSQQPLVSGQPCLVIFFFGGVPQGALPWSRDSVHGILEPTTTTDKLTIGFPIPTTERLEVNGAVRVGQAAGTTDGTIRWTGTDFEGRKAGVWTSMTSSGMAYYGLQVNGGMEVSQEYGTTATPLVGGSSKQVVDQLGVYVSASTTAAVSGQQITDSPAGYLNSLRTTVTTAQASMGAADEVLYFQGVEGYRIARLKWGTTLAVPLSISFWVKSSVTGVFAITLRGKGATIYTYCVDVTVIAANIWEYKTVLFPIPPVGSTWGTGNAGGMDLMFSLAAGSNNRSTPGVWNTGSKSGSVNGSNFVATNGSTFQITGLLVVPGTELPTADRAPFIQRPFDQELLTCMRYWEKSYDYQYAPGVAGNAPGYLQIIAPTTAGRFTAPFLVRKRAAPTYTIYAPNSGTSGMVSEWSGSAWADVSPSSVFGGENAVIISPVTVVGRIYGWHWVANARM